MSYEYDVFFSYKRDEESNDWHRRVKDKVKFWLDHELNRDCKIFFDTEEITVGARWRDKIGNALLKSKCIVCIWSPMYFQSEWCVSEWRTFEDRCQSSQTDLILPARYHDGQHYPAAANERQIFDFRNWASTISVFWETREALEFENEAIKPFVEEVARAIEVAPAFSDNFPLVDSPPAGLIVQRQPIRRIADA